MNEEPRDQSVREAWIDALLLAAYPTEQTSVGQRVEDVLSKLDRPQSPTRQPSATSTIRPRRWKRRVSLATAATILLAAIIGLQIYAPSQSALAAIEQSLVAAAQDVARHYLVSVTLRDTDNKTALVKSDLYVQGNDRFALRHPALLPGADGWLGQQGNQAWVVPAIGPVRIGDDLALSRWLRSQDELSTPYLHITTVLDRMSRGYRLKELERETITLTNGSRVACRHVIGRLMLTGNRKLPDTIELWADAESGVAQRLEAKWKLPPGEMGRANVLIEFAGQPDVPDDWFHAEGHFEQPRRVIHLDAAN